MQTHYYLDLHSVFFFNLLSILFGHPRPLQQLECWHHLDLWDKLTGVTLHQTIQTHLLTQLTRNWRCNHLQFFLATHFFQAKILMRWFHMLFYLPGLYEQQELAAVFKKIGDKQTCTIGLYELYRITQLYPKVLSIGYIQRMFKIALFISCEKCSWTSSVYIYDFNHVQCIFRFELYNVLSFLFCSYLMDHHSQVDIFAQLQNASEAFRTYIRDGLAQVWILRHGVWACFDSIVWGPI